MEYILELTETRQLAIPDDVLDQMELGPASKFVAKIQAGRLIIENLPFSAAEQSASLDRTIASVQKE